MQKDVAFLPLSGLLEAKRVRKKYVCRNSLTQTFALLSSHLPLIDSHLVSGSFHYWGPPFLGSRQLMGGLAVNTCWCIYEKSGRAEPKRERRIEYDSTIKCDWIMMISASLSPLAVLFWLRAVTNLPYTSSQRGREMRAHLGIERTSSMTLKGKGRAIRSLLFTLKTTLFQELRAILPARGHCSQACFRDGRSGRKLGIARIRLHLSLSDGTLFLQKNHSGSASFYPCRNF